MLHIIGHKNPDTDTICSALVYADFLNQKGTEAKAYALGPLNKETKFVFEKFGEKDPEHIKELPKGTEIILLDHNEEGQSIDNIKDLDIVEIIDHHKVKIETDKPISIYIEPLGSSCSIIAKKYFETRTELSKVNASLLIAGIISDTLFFRSPTTTQIDKDLVEKLNEIARIEDLEKFSLEMFNAKSDLGNMPVEEIIKLDYKIFEFAGNKYGIGVMETTNKDYGLNRKDEITAKLKEIKTKDELKAVFFSIVDILNEASYTLTSGDEETEMFTKIFGAVEKEGALFVDKLVSRKKQVVPRFQEYIK
ncbi:manganese-dependent inorganic pyrophosphatase [Candidatus Campbellbacteria bacterium RIFCSPLOWO2_01_FULL_34_15]|uniref:inorganic diphosphatase n=2 Tax=Candidatus Campbelliibacteriota TaxID=1752727 RepID=A0A1F5EM45_9BACT|nr:MAG: manganese-dependent inorganic pyrophosphatase [Candidatus Campbellbacteria bacterium RIFCSPLOWO2_01_FULL_34_15]OGD69477.1 MAG: manganese-dependent inorganic pyrophosphatase [Candidatus Campbellbacteria bacterium RIFCSPHIGHO2_01_FULL_34_10]